MKDYREYIPLALLNDIVEKMDGGSTLLTVQHERTILPYTKGLHDHTLKSLDREEIQ